MFFLPKLLQERVNLPQYGTCWKQAIQHIHEGCNALSEETQSDIALHLTNCFLEMSGHETYNCELDRKPNLRGICINSMTDRAFNVYTEFYTHTQNICWFLRGQIWQETIAENTFRVGQQLEISAENQKKLLEAQKESISIQQKLLQHGVILEEVIGGITSSLTQTHQNILNLQNWLVTEMSWFDTIVFYIVSLMFAFVLTSPQCTSASRLPVLILLCFNIFLERIVCNVLLKYSQERDVKVVHDQVVRCIWFLRYSLVVLCSSVIITSIFLYKDYSKINYVLLEKVYKQNLTLIEKLDKTKRPQILEPSVNILNEKSNSSYSNHQNKLHNSMKLGFESVCVTPVHGDNKHSDVHLFKNNSHIPKKLVMTPKIVNAELNGRYNLRSRQGTPNLDTTNDHR